MLFAFLYSWLRLFLDLVDLRLRAGNPEAELLLLRHQLRVLRRQVKRPRFEPADRAIMAALSRLVSRAALGSMLVRPQTVLGWHRELVRRKWAAFGRLRGPGRPRLSDQVVGLILRMVKENPNWGCVRIHGELLKVGYRVSVTAIRNLLRKRRVRGSPTRSGMSWMTFLKAQASAIVVTDFIEVDTVFLKRLYVLIYMELATRRVIWFGVTESPNAEWVTQQARNVAWALDEMGIEAKFLIRDNDAKFGGVSDLVMEGEGMTVIRTPIRAPLANAHIERQNGSARRECLDWILITNRGHLERVLAEWFAHYNQERPHRALKLKTPIARSDPVLPAATVHCRSRLGGLLRSYSAKPAMVAA
jgi:putative transposase